MSRPPLTPTSYVVLGLVAWLRRVTPYEMKQMVAISIGHFWTFPHSQLYAESDRLAAAGLLAVEQEDDGRRRKRYTLTDEGRAALREWLAEPSTETGEVRNLGLLQLFFGAFAGGDDVRALAQAQIAAQQALLTTYEETEADIAHDPALAYQAATLRLGKRVAEAYLGFWEEVAKDPALTRKGS